MDIIIAIYLNSNFRGYFGSQGWWLCFIIVPSIYLLTEMVCICMLIAYLLLWLRSKYRNLDLCQGVVVRGGGGGGGGGGLGLGLQGLYSAKLCRYNNEQTTKQTKAINNSYIYIYHVNVTQTVPDISPLMPMHQDPLLVVYDNQKRGSISFQWSQESCVEKSDFPPYVTPVVL